MGGNPTTFWTEALSWAEQAHAATGVLTSVVLSQWAIETGYGGADWSPNNNPGNVGSFDGEPVNRFATLAQGVEAYVQCMEQGYYTSVRDSIGYVNQSIALGNSPWASAHYRLAGGSNGSELIYVVQHYDLTQYDGVQPAPPTPNPAPTPPYIPVNNSIPQEIIMGLPTGCTDVNAVREYIRDKWNTYRSDVMTGGDQNLFQLVFYEPASSGGYAGNPDLLLAGIVDGGKTANALRPMWTNAV